jgi:hypothetical protein
MTRPHAFQIKSAVDSIGNALTAGLDKKEAYARARTVVAEQFGIPLRDVEQACRDVLNNVEPNKSNTFSWGTPVKGKVDVERASRGINAETAKIRRELENLALNESLSWKFATLEEARYAQRQIGWRVRQTSWGKDTKGAFATQIVDNVFTVQRKR